MCVLTGIRTGQYDRIMRWWSSKPQSGIDTVLESAAYCYVIIPRLPWCSIPRSSYHTRSFSHPGVTRIRPSISAYCKRSLDHPGVSRLRPSIPNPPYASPPPYGPYCVTLSPCRLLLLSSCETPEKVNRSCFSVTSWRHQAPLLRPPPSQPFYPSHTSNIGRDTTHCDTVSWRLPI